MSCLDPVQSQHWRSSAVRFTPPNQHSVLQTAGFRRSGVTTCQSSDSVLIRSWRPARGPRGSETFTLCTWLSCERWPKLCRSSSSLPSSCTPAEQRRTRSLKSCCWIFCSWPGQSEAGHWHQNRASSGFSATLDSIWSHSTSFMIMFSIQHSVCSIVLLSWKRCTVSFEISVYNYDIGCEIYVFLFMFLRISFCLVSQENKICPILYILYIPLLNSLWSFLMSWLLLSLVLLFYWLYNWQLVVTFLFLHTLHPDRSRCTLMRRLCLLGMKRKQPNWRSATI